MRFYGTCKAKLFICHGIVGYEKEHDAVREEEKIIANPPLRQKLSGWVDILRVSICAWNKSRRIREEYWYRETAYAGNAQAMQRLIKIYENGECDVSQDEEKAAYWRKQVEYWRRKKEGLF